MYDACGHIWTGTTRPGKAPTRAGCSLETPIEQLISFLFQISSFV
jgi:hypothetical protein